MAVASDEHHAPPGTRRAELLSARVLREAIDKTFRGALREAQGVFAIHEHGGADRPAHPHVHALDRLREEDAAFYAEFLTPLHGSGVKRNGAPDTTVSKAGVTAQKMRYLDLLLVSPWSVRVGPKLGVPVAADVDLLVPNPTSFIVQKLLIHSDRPAGKKAQDVLYIHDTLELFGASLGELHRLWLEPVRTAMAAKTARRAETVAQGLFAEVTDTIREAARIPQDRQLTPENLQRACAYGLGEVLGTAEAH